MTKRGTFRTLSTQQIHVTIDLNMKTSKSSNLFLGGGLLHSPSEGLGSRVARGAGQTVVTWHCVFTAMYSVVYVTGVRDLFALVNVLADDTVSPVANWTPATLEGAVGETGALGSSEAGTGETAIYGAGQNQTVILGTGPRYAPLTFTCVITLL